MKYLALAFLALSAITASAQSTQILDKANGTTVVLSAGRKLGFHGATPSARRAGSAQAAVTTTTGAAVASTAATNTTPYGFTTAAQADALVARVNQLIADNAAKTTLINELRAALVEKGLIKGAP